MRKPCSPAAGLICASFAVLFQELTLIRWMPSEVRVLAYFPNLLLLSAFLGLGLGCLRAEKRSLLWLWPLSLAVLVGATVLLGRIAFTQQSPTEHLWLLYADLGKSAPVVSDVRPPILFLFILGTLSFVAPGQLVAERLEAFRAQGRSLAGYSWDLLGSLAGTAAFAVACFAWSRPFLWFSVVLTAAALFFWSRPRLGLAYAGLAVATLTIVAFGARQHRLWSPYYALNVFPSQAFQLPGGVAVTANGSVHQYALDVAGDRSFDEHLDRIRPGYRIPYRRLGRKPGKVLVLGAGTGNDVAVALAEGAEHVDAVEIDPGIVQIGKDAHPNRPYDAPNVRVHVTDARSFLENSAERYDLIVFGTLDSMTRLSALSSVRLDNFVYTEECLRAARNHLTERGGVALYFMVGAQHIYQRLLATLFKAFDAPPRVETGSYDLFNVVFMAGPAFALADAGRARLELANAVNGEEPSSDDWPYLYLQSRGVTPFYLTLIVAIAALAVCGIALASPELRTSFAAGAVDLEMFLLGLAFLLLETRAVTEMTLVWGVSWLTSAVVFGAILLMVLLGTLARALKPLPWGLSLGLLAVLLVLGYALPTSWLLTPSIPLRLVRSVVFVGTPMFFAATLFAALFQRRPSVSAAFGWNLLGAVAGGLLEFVSMALGIKVLHLLALAAYLAVGMLRARAVRTVPGGAPDPTVVSADAP